MNDTHRGSPIMVILATALAPLIWGSTYLVTTEFLPPGRPFTAALLRVLPAGLLLLAWTREWPRWRDMGWLLMLSILNIAFFQAMLFVSAYRLPGGGEPTPYHCNFNRLYRRIRDDRTQKSRPYRRLSLFVLGMQGIQPSRHGWSFCSAYVVLLSDVMVCPHTQNSGYALSKITKYQRVPISAKGFSKVHVLTPSTSRTSSCRNPFFL